MKTLYYRIQCFVAKHATLWHTCPSIYNDALNKCYKFTTLDKIDLISCLYSSNIVTIRSSDLINPVIFLIRRQRVFSSLPTSKPEYCHIFCQRKHQHFLSKTPSSHIFFLYYISVISYWQTEPTTPLCYGQNVRQKINGWLFQQHVTLW